MEEVMHDVRLVVMNIVFLTRRGRHTRLTCDWSSDVCSSDLDANAIVGSIGIEQSELPRLIESKLDAIESLIARTAESQAFPLLGFSYYEYAQSLKEYDEGSALLYAES